MYKGLDYNKEVTGFLQNVLADYYKDHNNVRALRRLRMKRMHLKKKRDLRSYKFINGFERFLE